MIDKKTRYFIFGSSEPHWRKRYYFKNHKKMYLPMMIYPLKKNWEGLWVGEAVGPSPGWVAREAFSKEVTFDPRGKWCELMQLKKDRKARVGWTRGRLAELGKWPMLRLLKGASDVIEAILSLLIFLDFIMEYCESILTSLTNSFTNSWRIAEKRQERPRRKGKIYPFECRVSKDSKER